MTPDAFYAEILKEHPELPPYEYVRFFAVGSDDDTGPWVQITMRKPIETTPEKPPTITVCEDPGCETEVTGWEDYGLDDRMERILRPCGHAHPEPLELA